MDDLYYMDMALELAKEAAAEIRNWNTSLTYCTRNMKRAKNAITTSFTSSKPANNKEEPS